MKKIIAVLLTAAMLIGICGVSLSASAETLIRGVSDKICELRKCFSKSSNDDLIYAEIYYDVDTIPMTEEEKDDYIFEKCGVRAADARPVASPPRGAVGAGAPWRGGGRLHGRHQERVPP